MEKFHEIAVTAVRREMGMGRAVFLLIATLLLWCGSMLLVLDLAANASGTHGQVALIGLVLVAIGGSCLWADFFEVTSWFARERWVTAHVPHMIQAAFLPKVLHKKGASAEEKSQAGDADEGTSNGISAFQA
jgi:hypothetical protein